MRFMLDRPTFLPDGQYVDAAQDMPQIIDAPDDTDPSFTWIPLDKTAEAALAKYHAAKVAALKAQGMNETIAKRNCAVRPMPKGAERTANAEAIHMRPMPKAKPGEREQAMLEAALSEKAGTAVPPVAQQIRNMKRPSDQEPE